MPKFGEWDVNNPASADGFTVIFAKAKDDKGGGAANGGKQANNSKPQNGKPKVWTLRFYKFSFFTESLTLHVFHSCGCRRNGFAVSKHV